MKLQFRVSVELSHAGGKFVSSDELATLVADAISAADETSWMGQNEGEYVTDSWDVELNS